MFQEVPWSTKGFGSYEHGVHGGSFLREWGVCKGYNRGSYTAVFPLKRFFFGFLLHHQILCIVLFAIRFRKYIIVVKYNYLCELHNLDNLIINS